MQKTTYPFIITFGLWAEKDFGITHILLRRVVKKTFYAFSGKFRENHLLKKNIHFSFSPKVFLKKHKLFWKIILLTTVGVPAEKFGLFAKSFPPFCENCFHLVQRKKLNKNIFSSRSDCGRNIFDIRRKSFGSVVKTAFYVSRGKFWRIVFLHSNFSKPFWILAKSFWQVPKLRFQFPEEHLAGCVLNV